MSDARQSHMSAGAFTNRRRTDPPDVVAAIERGDYALARWLRCEQQLALIDQAPNAQERANRREFIVTASSVFEVIDMLTHDPGCA